MFYSVELLSIRQNAKFAKCWLAANLTTKTFHNKFRRQTVAAINIPQTCRELINHIKSHSSQHRMSLYLSSQLMFGATRILYYQTKTFLEMQWELWVKASAFRRILDAENAVGKKRGKKPLPVDRTLLPPEEPPATVYTIKNKNIADERTITLLEVDFCGEAIRVPDWPNFGALTAVELDQMLEPGGLRFDVSPPSVRVVPEIVDYSGPHTLRSSAHSIQHRATKKGTIDVDQIPNGNGTFTEIPLPELQDEISVTGVALQPPAVGEPPRTPGKRKLSPPSVMETPPTKKKGLEVQPEPVVPVEITGPIDEPQGPIDQPPAAPMLLRTSSNEMSLDTLESGVFKLRRTKKKARKLVIDFETELQRTQSPRAQKKTPKEAIKPIGKTAHELLATPSSRLVFGNKTLVARYREIILAPILQTAVSSDVQVSRPRRKSSRPEPDLLPIEPVRSPELSVNEQPPDMSDIKKPMTSTDVSKTDQTTTSEHVPIQDGSLKVGLPPGGLDDVTGPFGQLDTLPGLPGDDSIEQQLPPPDVSNLPRITRNVVRDWAANGQPQSVKSSSARDSTEKNGTHLDSSTKGSGETSTSRSSGTWVKADILGGLEVLWREKKIVCFKDICDIASSTKKDASRVFVLLLELHKSKSVKLTQAKPYCDVYIQKYSSFF